MGPMPCHRRSIEIAWRRAEFGQQLRAGVPGVMSTPPPIAKILALWLPPSPSARRCTRQCTTFTPAPRAAGSSRTMLGSASRRASSARTRKPGVRADDRALALLGDDRGVFRRGEFGEVDFHADAGTSPGAEAGMS